MDFLLSTFLFASLSLPSALDLLGHVLLYREYSLADMFFEPFARQHQPTNTVISCIYQTSKFIDELAYQSLTCKRSDSYFLELLCQYVPINSIGRKEHHWLFLEATYRSAI